MLFRYMPFGLVLAYIPKGPVGNLASSHRKYGAVSSTSFWEEIDRLCRDRGRLFRSSRYKRRQHRMRRHRRGFVPVYSKSSHGGTLLVDLTGDEAGHPGAYTKQKTR